MIKNIIFDLGNIIVQCPTLDAVKEFFKNENDAIVFNKYIFKSDFWKQMDLGKLTMLEASNKIREGKLVDVSDYDEIEYFMLNWFKRRTVNVDVMELGKKLKKDGYNIYILSNMAKETFEYLSDKYEFFSMVDGAVVSAFEGVKKPDPKIFDMLLNRYSLVAEESILIDDDDTNKTLEVANEIGIKGRRVNANDTEDIIKLLKENDIL